MLSNDGALSALCLRCTHGRQAHKALHGRKEGGGWNTTAAAAYPPPLNQFLAEKAVDSILLARATGRSAFGKHECRRELFSHRVLAECSNFQHGNALQGGSRRFQA